MSARGLAVVAVLLCTAAWGQDRPSEDELFGGEAQQEEVPPAESDRPSEAELFGDDAPDPGKGQEEAQDQPPGAEASDLDAVRLAGEGEDAFASGEVLDNPLTIGGQFYLQSIASFVENTNARDAAFSAPTLVDAYLDARPNDRIRAMVVGRLSFDPTLELPAEGEQPTVPDPSQVPTGIEATRTNPAVFLDQAWLRFDIGRTVFVTAGKQHVKWGTGFIWNPTDFLSPTPRNPLLFFDPRLGTSMVKFHVPWEATGWNFYAIALLDNSGAANVLGEIGGAGRAEIVLGEAELGIDAVFVKGRRPRYGVDFSAAVGPIDVYGEAALRFGSEQPRYELIGGTSFREVSTDGFNPQVTLGGTWMLPYADNELITFGAEYFYNDLGYDDAEIYPVLIGQQMLTGRPLFNPLYVSRHSLGVYALLAGPGSWERTSFTLFNVMSLSDLSGQTRLNASVRVLTYLSLEAFGAVHWGNRGGVFRFEFDPANYGLDPALRVNAPIAEFGIGARVSI